jgi:hypothetical protein
LIYCKKHIKFKINHAPLYFVHTRRRQIGHVAYRLIYANAATHMHANLAQQRLGHCKPTFCVPCDQRIDYYVYSLFLVLNIVSMKKVSKRQR